MKKPEGSGRKKGTLNKGTYEVREKLAKLGCDPIEGMARIALDCESGFIKKLRKIVESGADEVRVNEIQNALKDMNLAGSMYKELAQYVAPKRKAVELSGNDGNPVEMVTKIERVIIRK